MGDFIKRTPQWSLETFHAFRDERPKSEKWELIDGVPVMMPPPTLIHQRISRNIETMINAVPPRRSLGGRRRTRSECLRSEEKWLELPRFQRS